jgi:hypothetical protein
MNMSIEWSLTVIALSFSILTLSAAVFFWQARRTAKAIEASLETLNSKLPEFLAKFEDILSSILTSSQNIRSQVDSLAFALSRTRTLFDLIFNFEKVLLGGLTGPLFRLFGNAGALRKGLTAFVAALANPTKTAAK